jgi:hypothetical protein
MQDRRADQGCGNSLRLPESATRKTKYFHQFCRQAGNAVIENIEANSKKRARDGVWIVARFQGATVYARDPALIGKPWLVDMLGLDAILRQVCPCPN